MDVSGYERWSRRPVVLRLWPRARAAHAVSRTKRKLTRVLLVVDSCGYVRWRTERPCAFT